MRITMNIKKIIVNIFGAAFMLLGIGIMIASANLYFGKSIEVDGKVFQYNKKDVSENKITASGNEITVSTNETEEEAKYKVKWNDKNGEEVTYRISSKEGYKDGDIMKVKVDEKTWKYRIPDKAGFIKCVVFGTIFVIAGLAIIFLIRPKKINRKNDFGGIMFKKDNK